MPKYKVFITENITRFIEIEAKDEESAKRKALKIDRSLLSVHYYFGEVSNVEKLS